MLLARGLQHQGQAFCQGLEKDLAAKEAWIWALEQELDAARKLAKENDAAHKTDEEQIKKMRHDFEEYRKEKRNERSKIVAGAQRAVNVYRELIESMGEEMEAPDDAPIVDFMEWLANELATVSDYKTIGPEYASFVSHRTFAQALEECRCDHLDKYEVKVPQSYWNAPSRAHEVQKRFFEGFWCPRGSHPP